MFGCAPAPGALASAARKATGFLAPALAAITRHLIAAEVAHFDETGFRTAGRLAWVHSASAGKSALFTVHAKRGKEGMKAAPGSCPPSRASSSTTPERPTAPSTALPATPCAVPIIPGSSRSLAPARTSIMRGRGSPLVEQEAWAWLAGTQLVRASATATLRSEEAAARALRRKDARPVTADEESFTAAWRHAIRSMESTQVTAASSLAAIAAAGDPAARAHLHTLNVPGRDRHSPRKQKARPKFPHTSATKQTVTGKYQVTVWAPGRY